MPTARFPHLSGCICLECIQNSFWFAVSRDHSVNVIRPGIYCEQYPASYLTSLLDGVFNSRSSPRAEFHRGLLEGGQIIFSPLLVGRNAWRPITIVKTIYRAASVAMEPCAVSSKGDEVSNRDIF